MSKEIWLLSLVMLINRSGAMVLPFLSIYLNQELSFSFKQTGIVMACFGLGSVTGAFLGGIITDRIGYFRVMYTSLLLTGLAFFGLMFLKDFYALCGGIFILSLIADSFRPANLTAIEAFSKKGNLTRSLSLVRLAINLGYAIGPFLGGYVASLVGYDFLFILNGSSIVMGGTVFYFLFRNRKRKSAPDKLTEAQIAERDLPWFNGNYLLYLVLFMITIVVFFQLIYSVPLFFKREYLFDESKIGLLMALNGLIIAIIEMPLIYKIENRFRPISLVVFGGILIGIGFLFLSIIPHYLTAALIFTCFITVGEILSFPFSNTYALSFAQDHNRGKYMGLYTMTFSVSHIFSPICGMYIIGAWGFDILWEGGAALCIAASLMIIVTKMRKAQVR
ncbi:MAG: MFS transporter [Saprospiraceae bacterium]|nr:MFS transporter [Saprospiraceae bacterium]